MVVEIFFKLVIMAGNIFNTVKMPKVGSSNFDLSYDHKLSLDAGVLVPFHLQECVPGDSYRMSAEILLRFAPMLAPVMHRINVFTHFFFVPNRIVWDGWDDWIFNDDSLRVPPTLNIGPTISEGALADYLGVPVPVVVDTPVSALPFAAYQKIYNEYYRDQNLIDPVDDVLQDGLQPAPTASLNSIRRRAWMHDYFTASLPFAQKGDAVDIPITFADNIPVNYTGVGGPLHGAFVNHDTGASPANSTLETHGSDGSIGTTPTSPTTNLDYAPNGTLTVDIAANAATIRDLRRAFRMQEWLEINARAGTRPQESLMAHFGVYGSDARLNRPEYIGGSKKPVIISEVLQTSETATSPQGNMAGHGISVGQGGTLRYTCKEHGYMFGIMSVMPMTAYQQGLPRHFSKYTDRLNYYWPTFQNIGEQEVLNQEVYNNHADRAGVFGYVPRYAEYKYNPSRVSGDFKTTLNFWHWGRIFSTDPALNQSFIECNPGKRIFAVTGDEHSIWAHAFMNIRARRKMQRFGNPSF